MRREKAVWWQWTGTDEFGEDSFATPVEIECRWEKDIVQLVDYQGKSLTSKDTIYVDRLMNTNDRLFQGELSDLPSLSVLPQDTDAVKILQFENLPTIRYNARLLVAYA